ncbi:MAG: transporter family protein [Candidatus Xenobia bacterium]
MIAKKILAIGAVLISLTLSAPVRAEEPPAQGDGHPVESQQPEEHAEEEEKDLFDFTERPEIGIPSYSVEKGWTQLETGFATQSFKGGGSNLFLFNALLRYGVSDNLELRIQSSYNSLAGVSGIGDTSVGAKWNFKQGHNSLGLIGNVLIPSSTAPFRNAGTVPQLIFAQDIEIGEKGVLGYNIGAQSPVDPITGVRFVQGLFSEYYAWQIAPHTGAFFEFAVFTPATFGGVTLQELNGGLTYIIGRNTELDLGVIKGMSGQPGTLDLQPTLGFSRRWK